MIRSAAAVAIGLAACLSPLPAGSASSTVTVTIATGEKAVDWKGRWSRMEIADAAGSLQAAPEPAKVLFEVDPQLFVSMSVGCNRIGSQLQPGEGDAITFAPGLATRMACMGAIGAAEERLVDAIGKIARYERRGDDVVFLDADGRPLLLIGR